MIHKKIFRAIGLMSGTSFDGIDIALIETDGRMHVNPVSHDFYPYPEEGRALIRKVLGRQEQDDDVRAAAQFVTDCHVDLLANFMAKFNIRAHEIDVIGFHGQTIFHDPSQKFTWQIGSPNAVAEATNIWVVGDMRIADMKEGGQGAPLLPLYHRALADELAKPLAFLNVGGVSNITWISEGDILAFDCGPGNALMDDFVEERTGKQYDEGGALASGGSAVDALVAHWMRNPYFEMAAPKSLDRDAWDVSGVNALSDADGVATLLAFTIASIKAGLDICPEMPEQVLVTGGGRHNATLVAALADALPMPVAPVEAEGWNGDVIEAQGFAYLAVRSLLGLPLTEPGTTGVSKPLTGGVLYSKSGSASVG